VPRLLYLGDWGHAEDVERLQDINVKNIVTIHNHPGRYRRQEL
jgi:dual specificity MAP kinase phosphatase